MSSGEGNDGIDTMPRAVPLDIAIGDYPHTRAIRDGRIPIEGVAPRFVDVVPQIAAYRRMVRETEFDVCEVAATTYIVARAHGAAFVALPIFLTRAFHHGGLLVHPDAGVTTPRDLDGHKVGVRAYTVTTGVWARGILAGDYGLDLDTVTWIVDDEEHVRELRLPRNVVSVPLGDSLVAMMARGELAAAFAGNAGIGRSGAPAAGWDTAKQTAPAYRDLIPDAAVREAEWYRRTGIYPLHGTIVVKDDVLARHPWIARSLSDAFERAKAEWLADLHAGRADTPADRRYRDLIPVVGPDPLPLGIEPNRASIKALESFAYAQHLISCRMSIADLFVSP